jgi:hypothetical protein
MFTKIKELCRLIGGVSEEREEKRKVVNHVVFIRKESHIDRAKLESMGFHVVEGDHIEEGKDFKFIESIQVTTTTYSREVEE